MASPSRPNAGNGAKEGYVRLTTRTLHIIALTITLVWAASFVADVAIPEYAPPAGIHGIMLTMVGAVFGYQFVSKRAGNGANGGFSND